MKTEGLSLDPRPAMGPLRTVVDRGSLPVGMWLKLSCGHMLRRRRSIPNFTVERARCWLCSRAGEEGGG